MGGYYDPQAADPAIHVLHGRDDFLFHAGNMEPRVLDELRAVHEVFLKTGYAETARPRPASFAPPAPPWPPADPFLRERLVAWATAWRLNAEDSTDPWILDTAWCTLFDWTREGNDRSMFSPCRPPSNGVFSTRPGPPIPPFSFQVPAWPMDRWSREEMREWTEAAFKRKLAEYLNEAEIGARRHGWEPVARNNARLRLSADRHFEWLARYQCRGEAQTAIASADGISANKISAGIHKVARLIGLSVYNGKARLRGPRPPKGKNR